MSAGSDNPESRLLEAALRLDVATMAQSIDAIRRHGGDPEEVADGHRRNALHLVALSKDFGTSAERRKAASFLLKEGFVVEAVDHQGMQSIAHAALASDWDMVEFLLDHGADIEAKDEGGYTLLDVALLNEDNKGILWLADKGADLSHRVPNGECVIHLATRPEIDVAFLKKLLDSGIDPLTLDHSPNAFDVPPTALHLAAEEGLLEHMAVLVDAGVPVDGIPGTKEDRAKGGARPAMWALQGIIRPESLAWLAKHGADLNANGEILGAFCNQFDYVADVERFTTADLLQGDMGEGIAALLDAGMDPFAKSDSGHRVLDAALEIIQNHKVRDALNEAMQPLEDELTLTGLSPETESAASNDPGL